MMNLDAFLAYIDPSSGSLAIQFVIAAAASGALIFRRVLLAPFFAAGRLLRAHRSRESTPAAGPNG